MIAKTKRSKTVRITLLDCQIQTVYTAYQKHLINGILFDKPCNIFFYRQQEV